MNKNHPLKNLWKHMNRRHGLALLESELSDICDLATCQAIINLMEKRGFQVGRGTHRFPSGETAPTWEITRPSAPYWRGVKSTWEHNPDNIEENEQHTLFLLGFMALNEWERVYWMYED
jgi:hypothetical protein